uniref:N-ribosyldihydronicotinamide:quinone dehydrogenase 2 n=1 Tax=Macaca mulatta TaxID=9544 RepID=F7H0W0_MACMU
MAGKKVLIVYAHEEPRSFNGSLKNVAVDELSRQGCTVTVSDLYAMNFEPRATRKDITAALSNPEVFNYGVETYEAYKQKSLASDITDEQKKVGEADLVIFQGKLALLSVTTGGTAECTRRRESMGIFDTSCGHSSTAHYTSVDLKSLPLRSILLLKLHPKKKERRWWLHGPRGCRPSGRRSPSPAWPPGTSGNNSVARGHHVSSTLGDPGTGKEKTVLS